MGERFIEQLWELPFGRDFLFANPKYKKDGNEYELCDLLLLLDGTAVLVEIKTANRATKHGWDDSDWADWANNKLQHALGQMPGRLEDLLDGRVGRVKNPRQGRVPIDPDTLEKLYGIVVVDTPPLSHSGRAPVLEVRGRPVPVLVTSHANMIEIVTELSTPMDLIDYLGAHARFFENNTLQDASELDLLALYKQDPREFLAKLDAHRTISPEPGHWESFAQQESRQQRSEFDRPSRIIDEMINYKDPSRFNELNHTDARILAGDRPSPTKEQKRWPVTALARTRRMERRQIGRMLEQKSELCLREARGRYFGFPVMDQRDTMLVFLVTNDDLAARLQELDELCEAAILKFVRPQVFGYALKPLIPGRCRRLDGTSIRQHPRSLWHSLSEEERERRLRRFPSITSGHETEFGGPEAPPTTTPLDAGGGWASIA